jgi:predicted N-acetyltransferase YhbS
MSHIYRTYQQGDEASLEQLLKRTFPRFNESNIWQWKYTQNPGFDNSLLIVAENDKEIIGSNLWLLREFKLLDNLSVPAALAADIAVDTNYRGHGIGSKLMLYPRLSGTFKAHKLLLSYMFGRPELNKRFYKPVAGYVVAPSNTITYKKLFNCKQLSDKFQQIDRAVNSDKDLIQALEHFTLSIAFFLKGASAFTVIIKPGKISLDEGKIEKPDVIIEGKLPLSVLTISGGITTGYLVKSWVTGKFKITKGITKVFKVRRAFQILQTALKKNS